MSSEQLSRGGKAKRRSDNPSWRSQKSPLREKENKNESRTERPRRDSGRQTVEAGSAESRPQSSVKSKEAGGNEPQLADDADLPKMHSSPLWSESAANESGDNESSKENADSDERSKDAKNKRSFALLA